MNSKHKGDSAIAHAIRYYLCNGYEVCLPIGDKRDYDLIIEMGGDLHKVQVKFAGFYPAKQQCFAGLRITGGNQSYNYAKKYKDNSFDRLFVHTAKNESYEIEWSKVSARSELAIESSKYASYRVA